MPRKNAILCSFAVFFFFGRRVLAKCYSETMKIMLKMGKLVSTLKTLTVFEPFVYNFFSSFFILLILVSYSHRSWSISGFFFLILFIFGWTFWILIWSVRVLVWRCKSREWLVFCSVQMWLILHVLFFVAIFLFHRNSV